MDPDYSILVDPATVVPTLFASLVHIVALASELGVGLFLIASGAHDLLRPGHDSPWLRRLGAIRGAAGQGGRRSGGVRLVLGVLVLLPVTTGAPFLIAPLACAMAAVLLVLAERRMVEADRRPGRFARHTAIAAAAFAALFMLWEREDSIALGAEVLRVAAIDRSAALEWQLAGDRKSPKVGDLAPDFELQDPSGERSVRLSEFRGRRPVALVFGSYT